MKHADQSIKDQTAYLRKHLKNGNNILKMENY